MPLPGRASQANRPAQDPERGLSRGELARLAELHPETIRFYERCGLLPPPPRSAAGHRIYAPAILEELALVKRLRHLGFSLAEVRVALVLRGGTTEEANELERLLLEMDSKVDRLHALLRCARPQG